MFRVHLTDTNEMVIIEKTGWKKNGGKTTQIQNGFGLLSEEKKKQINEPSTEKWMRRKAQRKHFYRQILIRVKTIAVAWWI